MAAATCLRVLVLGGTRTGKSSLGNTLLGRDEFQTSRSIRCLTSTPSSTQTCQSAETQVQEIHIRVTDTPALIKTHLDGQTVLAEVKKCAELISPGPHVILVMFRLDYGFTEEDYQDYIALKLLFGGCTEQYTIIVFSGIDFFGGTTEEQEKSFDEIIRGAEGSLHKMLTDVRGCCVGVSNCASNRKHQMTKILLKIKGLLMINGGRYFANHVSPFASMVRRFRREKDTSSRLVAQFQKLYFGERRNVKRVVLLGKTGAGKSSLGNTLLAIQHDPFMVARGLNSGTQKCQWKEGTEYEVVDTPGLCDTHRPNREVLKEIAKCVALAFPGPHVIFMVLRCDRRFTEEEYGAYISLKKMFGDNLKKFMIIVFVGMDALGRSVEEQEEELKDQIEKNPKLREITKDAGGRYIGVSNTDPNVREVQASKLRDMMKEMVEKNDPSFFRSQLYVEVNAIMKGNVQQRMVSNQTTENEAETQTKQAIVDGELDEGFLIIIINAIRAHMKSLFGGHAEAEAGDKEGELSKTCSVM